MPRSLFLGAAALVALLAVLATLQYRWLGQVGEADAARLRTGALAGAEQLARDFDRETTRAFLWLQVPAAGALGPETAAFAERHGRWSRATAHPRLVRDVFFVFIEGESLLRFAPSEGRFQAADWPPALAPLRERLREATLRPSVAAQARRRWPFDLILDEVPAIVVPVPSLEMARARGHESQVLFRLAGLTVIQLDLDYIKGQLLPALARRHFGGEDAVYSLRVEREGDPGQVVFRSEPGGPDARGQGDASVAFLDVRMDLASQDDLGALRAPPAPSARPEMRHFGWIGRGESPRRRPASGRWRLVATHRAGSVDAVVAAARRRNLAVSGGILALLAASAVLIVVSAQRARLLADRQIEFVAAVSHELRTPVSVLCSAGENLADGVVHGPEAVRQYGRLVHGEGRRLAEMVEQVLDYAGTYAGRSLWRFEEVSLPELIDESLAGLQGALREGGIAVETAIAPGLPRVCADRGALRRAVQNLLQNAAKYGGDARRVAVRAGVSRAGEGRRAWITVEDHGLGIPAAEIPRLFEPFFRGAEVVSRQIRGTGLGLSLVKRIVEAHGGTVGVVSRPGQGSAFTITLPA